MTPSGKLSPLSDKAPAETLPMINVFQPSLGDEELEAMRKVMASNWTGKGRVTQDFERAFAAHARVPDGNMRSVSCCTEGLFQAVQCLGMPAGSEVILPSISFVGAANAVAAQGFRPVFCDVDPRTLNATAALIEEKISPKTRAILLIHYGGLPCEMDPIVELAARKGLAVIEDSACSVASRYRGKLCGTIGDFGVWSFDSMKILVAGDGGMVFARDAARAEWIEKAVYLGLETASGISGSVYDRWWEFEISQFGRRAIMNDIASAAALVQLGRLESFISKRKEISGLYDREFRDIGGLTLPLAPLPHMESSYYFYWIQTKPALRDRLAVYLRERKIYTTFRYYPLHLVKRYGSEDRLTGAEKAASTTLCIPLHQALSSAETGRVIDAVRDFFKSAC